MDFLNPQEYESAPPEDPNLRLSLLNFISLMGSTQETYEVIRGNTQQIFPGAELLLYYQANEQRTRTLPGLTFWEHHTPHVPQVLHYIHRALFTLGNLPNLWGALLRPEGTQGVK